MIPDASLDELIEMYQSCYAKKLSRAEALEVGTNIISFFEAVYKPIEYNNETYGQAET